MEASKGEPVKAAIRPFSIVIARQRVRPLAGPMTGSGGRSSTPRASSSGTASLRPHPRDYWMPASAGHDSREAYVSAYAHPRGRTECDEPIQLSIDRELRRG